MPLQSKSQGRFLNWKFGHDWVKQHHFGGSQKDLPQHVNAQGGLNTVPMPAPIKPFNPGYDLFKKKLMLVRGRKRPGTAQQPGLPPDLPKSVF